MRCKKSTDGKALTSAEFGGDPNRKVFYRDHLIKKDQEIPTQPVELYDYYFIWTSKGKVLGRSKETSNEAFYIRAKEEVNLHSKNKRPRASIKLTKNTKSWKMEDN